MLEIWKDVVGYEGFYQVSNYGKIRSMDREITQKNGRKRFYKGEIKSFAKDKDGYLIVCLNKEGKQKNHKVHRLVGESFIVNYENKPLINHIDEDKSNNHVENLEWATHYENNTHGTRIIKTIEENSIPVKAFRNGLLVGQYSSLTECAGALSISSSGISMVLSGKRKTSGGYTFQLNN